MIAILNTNGNIGSVVNAFQKLGQPCVVTRDLQILQKADRIVLPGQGAAGPVMALLRRYGLDTFLRETKKPVLGICLGLQLMAERSEEGDTECLGLIPGTVRRFRTSLPVPHVGWNKIFDFRFQNSQIKNLKSKIKNQNDFFYFTHSYYLPVGDCTLATAVYDTPFSAIIQKENFLGVQFHPEKSGDVGQKILQNFCHL